MGSYDLINGIILYMFRDIDGERNENTWNHLVQEVRMISQSEGGRFKLLLSSEGRGYGKERFSKVQNMT